MLSALPYLTGGCMAETLPHFWPPSKYLPAWHGLLATPTAALGGADVVEDESLML